MKESKIEKLNSKKFIHQAIQISKKLRLYLVSILNEKYKYFLWYLVFFREKTNPKVKGQEVRDQVSTSFSKAPQRYLTFG